MSLQGTDNAEKIWNFLKGKGLNDYGTAGLMGNLFAESGLNPANLQNSFEAKLGMNDDQYTTSVDNGDYTNFIHDSAGYGLAQWTYWSRKKNLIEYVQKQGKSIADLETQLNFLIKEIESDYKSVFSTLKTVTSVAKASNCVLLEYERPANQGTTVQNTRAGYSQTYYNKFAKGEKVMSNSSLISYTKLSPNHSGQRTHAIDRISPHCVVGQLSCERICGCFTSSSAQASCNYGIGTDGRISLCVEEKNRSWCTSSSANDQRAVTIECASDRSEPYTMNSNVYNSLIKLCVDICKRNGKKKLLWFSDKNTALNYSPKTDEMVLTVHRWFANKSCPGNWLYSRMGDLASKVTAQLGGTSTPASSAQTTTEKNLYRVRKSWSDIKSQIGAYSSLDKAKAACKTGYTVYDWNGKAVYSVSTSSSSASSYPTVPFTVTVLIPDLNYRSSPSMSGSVKGQTGKGVFTIVEVKNGWGRLKSDAGWIYLENKSYCTVNK